MNEALSFHVLDRLAPAAIAIAALAFPTGATATLVTGIDETLSIPTGKPLTLEERGDRRNNVRSGRGPRVLGGVLYRRL